MRPALTRSKSKVQKLQSTDTTYKNKSEIKTIHSHFALGLASFKFNNSIRLVHDPDHGRELKKLRKVDQLKFTKQDKAGIKIPIFPT